MENKYLEVANILAKIEALKIEVEGYKAFNATRLDQGYSIGYQEEVFFGVASDIRALAEKLLTFKEPPQETE